MQFVYCMTQWRGKNSEFNQLEINKNSNKIKFALHLKFIHSTIRRFETNNIILTFHKSLHICDSHYTYITRDAAIYLIVTIILLLIVYAVNRYDHFIHLCIIIFVFFVWLLFTIYCLLCVYIANHLASKSNATTSNLGVCVCVCLHVRSIHSRMVTRVVLLFVSPLSTSQQIF